MAVSLDGFIADKDGGTSWVDDFEQWEQAAKKTGNMIVGHKTFDEIKADLFTGVHYFVLGSGHDSDLVTFGTDPASLLGKSEAKGFQETLLCGGGLANQAFLMFGLINELNLDVHPLLLGKGIKLFGDLQEELRLELRSSHVLTDGIIQNSYKVIKFQQC